MYKIVRKTEAVVREIADTYEARNYITKADTPAVSLAVNAATDHTELETTDYDRIYYVTNGELQFEVDGKNEVAVAGDAVLISAGTQYTFGGTFEAVVVNQPAFGS